MRTRRAAPAANGPRRLLAAGAALLTLLTGCGAAPHHSGTDAGPAPVTLTWFAGSITQSANDPRQVLVDTFERAHPDIHVDLVSGPADTDTARTTLVHEIRAGGPAAPDVYLGDVTWPAEFAQDGLALRLDQYFPAAFWKRFAGVVPGGSGTAEYGGAHYAVPFYIDEGFLYYRSDLLRQAGLPIPTTWQQVTADALTLQRDHRVRQGFIWQGAAYEGLTCDWTEFLADAVGGRPFDGGTAAVAGSMASPQALRALEFMRSLLTGGVSPGTVLHDEEPAGNDAFDAGDAAFLRGWDSSWSSAQSATSAVRGKVGVVPLPGFDSASGGFSTVGGWDLYISPHSDHIAADTTFVDWLTGTQAQRVLASQYTEIPANTEVRTDPAIARDNPVLAAAARTSVVGRPAQLVDYPAVSRDVFTTVHSALAAPTTTDAGLCLRLTGAAHRIDPTVHGTLHCAAAAGG